MRGLGQRLCQRLGVTATAIYHYYANREELLDAIVADQLFALLSALIRRAADYSPMVPPEAQAVSPA